MDKEQLFAAMEGIDETQIEQSKGTMLKKKTLWKRAALAACVGIVLCAAYFIFGFGKVEYYDRQWTAVYNEKMESPFTACISFPPGYYREDLSEDQWEEILPGKRGSWQVESANAGFLVNGEADKVSLILVTNMEGVSNVHLSIGNVGNPFYMGSKTFEKSKCGDQEFALVRDELPSSAAWKIKLEGYTRIEDVGLHFSMSCNDEEYGKAVLQAVMECFTWYDGEPEMDAVEPSRIPEYRHDKMSYEDALEDPDFGRWILKDLPKDFSPGEIYRDIDYYSDELSCSFRDESGRFQWCVPNFRWCASRFTENEEDRLVSVSEKEIYDISRYPPPRVETVPREIEMRVKNPIFRIEELTLEAVRLRYDEGEINGNPYNDMVFGVLYGDILVEVSTVNMEPEWLYEQLMKLPRE